MQNFQGKNPPASLFNLLKPYKKMLVSLIVLALFSNALTLWLPRLLSRGIDGFLRNGSLGIIFWQFSGAALIIFVLTYLQGVVQTYASEKVARDLRKDFSEKVSTRTFMEVEEWTPSKLLTNLTSDIDSVKNFVAQAVVNIVSSVFLIIGAVFLLVSINWRLGILVLAVVPIIGITFFIILKKVRGIFLQSREIIDWLNKVINESILGAGLIRVLNSQAVEHAKFTEANSRARNLGLRILKLFAGMIPIVTFSANLAGLIILVVGGKFVIGKTMTLGDFASFNSYLVILIFPMILIGIMSNFIAQAQASYDRIFAVLSSAQPRTEGAIQVPLKGKIRVNKVNLQHGQKSVLKDVSFEVRPGERAAIIGPTAAGKSQLLNLLIGLTHPNSGEVLYDEVNINDYKTENLYKQVGLVFQDSVIFNISLRENIAFNTSVSRESMERAIQTTELTDFVNSLPEGLDSIVAERGSSLSGGQKQRIMLARALAINPKILLLDDFTARVDSATEKKILGNIAVNYPDITLVSVTQKISSVENYDTIILLMEGEVIAVGKHSQLLESCPEYVQIYNSQQSTSAYELQS